MKKIIIALLLLLCSFTFISCGKQEEDLDDDFLDYKGTIYDKDNYTSVDNENLTGEYKLAKNVQDGVILHAWNWSYKTIESNLKSIASAGFSAVQTSPVQPAKDYSPSLTSVNDCWWKLYQPLGFSVAENCWLGTKDELISLCTEADKYGIKIICDIVANHLAGGTANSFNQNVRNYEQEIYDQNLLHQVSQTGSSVFSEVRQPLGDYPDLQTESTVVQERVISLLKECIDCGVDGFRFDAAKHIETSTDGQYASNFWVNVLDTTNQYAITKNTKLYIYGEVLNNLANGRQMETYTNLMSVTDNGTSGNIATRVISFLGSQPAGWEQLLLDSLEYSKTNEPSKVVLWVESHDTYTEDTLKTESTNPFSTTKVNRVWTVVGNRKGASALYFARPAWDRDTRLYTSHMGEVGTNNYLDDIVVSTNKFHNAFIGADEKITIQNGCLVNERKRTSDNKCGVIITNIANESECYLRNIEVGLKDGLYIDYVSGNRFLVEKGILRGKMSDGVVVLYEAKRVSLTPSPLIQVTHTSTKFYQGQETKVTFNVTTDGATKTTYKIGNGNEVEFKNSFTITNNATITITAYGKDFNTVKTINIDDIEAGIVKKNGYVAIAGVTQNIFDNYSIYAWVWGTSSTWKEVLIENGVVYVPVTTGETGLLLAIFDKDFTLSSFGNIHKWNDNCIMQTGDYEPFDVNTCYSSGLN